LVACFLACEFVKVGGRGKEEGKRERDREWAKETETGRSKWVGADR